MKVQATTFSVVCKSWGILNRSEKNKFFVVGFFLLLGAILELASVAFILPLVSVVADETFLKRHEIVNDLLRNPSQQELVLITFALLMLIFVVKSAFLAYSMWYQRGVAADIEYRMATDLFRRYMNQNYIDYVATNSSVLVRNVNSSADFISITIDPLLILGTDGIALLAIAIFLCVVEPLGTVVSFLMLGIMAWSFHAISKRAISHWGDERLMRIARKVQYLQEGFGALKDLQILGRQDTFVTRYASEVRYATRLNRKYATITNLPRIWLELLSIGGLGVLAITLIVQGMTATEMLPILGLFAAASFRIMPSVNRILFAVQNLNYSSSSVDILAKDLSVQGESPDVVDESLVFENEILVQGINFTYPDSQSVGIHDINFSILHGQSIGIIGTSGAGKSTLVDLLMGLLPASSGDILVDGKSVVGGSKAWREMIGYVPQNIYLTDDTLRNNIAFGIDPEEIDSTWVNSAVQSAALASFIERLPMGLDTVIGEHGVRMSGGQRQRIGIARALYHQPRILILDEATSALDTGTEQEIVKEVALLRGEKTILIVTHRMSTIEMCDKIIRLENGHIVPETLSNNPNN